MPSIYWVTAAMRWWADSLLGTSVDMAVRDAIPYSAPLRVVFSEQVWLRRLQRLLGSILEALTKAVEAPTRRYAGSCEHILKYETEPWVFFRYPGTQLSNNEVERSVILHKICLGTSSDNGDKFCSYWPSSRAAKSAACRQSKWSVWSFGHSWQANSDVFNLT